MEQMAEYAAAEKTGSFFEKTFLKQGRVLAVRAWQPATFFEVDVHLPGINMNDWREAQHIKCKVGPFAFRDYTPAWWDAETSTCTLFIDAAHNGAGSRWVKTLQPEDYFYYGGVSPSHHRPVKNAQHVLLGDQTAIGHFLALHQLAGNNINIQGAVTVKESHHRDEFDEYITKLNVRCLPANNNTAASLTQWLHSNKYGSDAVFYLAGNSHMAGQMRKTLKQMGYAGQQINAQGFWQ